MFWWGTHLAELTGSFFAEFLNEVSPVHLGILYQPTCVGLRYGFRHFNPTGFSRQPICPRWEKTSLRKSNNPLGLLSCVTFQKMAEGPEY